MRKLRLRTWNHLGDTLLLGAAIRNLEVSIYGKEFQVWVSSAYNDLFQGWEYVHVDDAPSDAKALTIGYGGKKGADKSAIRGTLNEAWTRTLGELLGIEIPFSVRTMPIFLTPTEKRKYATYSGCVVLNSNCLTCSMTKRYPHWQEVANLLRPHKVVLIGSRESRNVFHKVEGENIIDLRGKTDNRDLCSLVSVCAGVVSPPSGVVHLAACFNKPAVYMSGAREPIGLIDYPGCVPIATSCQDGRYHSEHGCLHLFSCEGQLEIDGQKYPQCLAKIPPEDIANEAIWRFWGRS